MGRRKRYYYYDSRRKPAKVGCGTLSLAGCLGCGSVFALTLVTGMALLGHFLTKVE